MMPRLRARRASLLLVSVLALVLAGCGLGTDDSTGSASAEGDHSAHEKDAGTPSASESAEAGAGHHGARAAPVRRKPLRAGERRVNVTMPADYTPSAPTGEGTDDYRCFLLDPGVARDQFITGFNVLPGNPEVVHHVIMFRVPPDLVEEAEQKDASTPEQGWTCFGNSGLGGGAEIDDAPWLGAWAPGGSEQVFANGFGEKLEAGSRVVMQVHYNLLAGKSPDRSAAELRLAPASRRIKALETRLLPAPVELPCRPKYAAGELCKRPAALADVKQRFGQGPGATADLLHFLCGKGRPGPVQSCTRTIMKPETVRGVAGHMHLLGRSIKVEVNPGTPRARTLLDIPVWNFDDQGSRAIKPAALKPLDTIKVTCRHDQRLRAQPSFQGQPDKYVLWGEGTTDEMCLGILLVTRP